MLLTPELLQLKELFLKGVIQSVNFQQDKLGVFVSYNKHRGNYFYQVDYNKCEAWSIDESSSPKLAWDNVIGSINTLQMIIDDPEGVLAERIAKIDWVSKEKHEQIINEIIGE